MSVVRTSGVKRLSEYIQLLGWVEVWWIFSVWSCSVVDLLDICVVVLLLHQQLPLIFHWWTDTLTLSRKIHWLPCRGINCPLDNVELLRPRGSKVENHRPLYLTFGMMFSCWCPVCFLFTPHFLLHLFNTVSNISLTNLVSQWCLLWIEAAFSVTCCHGHQAPCTVMCVCVVDPWAHMLTSSSDSFWLLAVAPSFLHRPLCFVPYESYRPQKKKIISIYRQFLKSHRSPFCEAYMSTHTPSTNVPSLSLLYQAVPL